MVPVSKPKNGTAFNEEDWNLVSEVATEGYWASKVRCMLQHLAAQCNYNTQCEL